MFRKFAIKIATRIFNAEKHVYLKEDQKLLTRHQVDYVCAIKRLFELSERTVGHVIELGVGRGRNSIIFGRLIKHANQQEFKRYIGFDTFEGFTQADLESTPHLAATAHKDTSLDFVIGQCRANDCDDVCEFVKGDILQTLPAIVSNPRTNMKFSAGQLVVSLLYIDCNAYRPASFALDYLKGYLADGAIIAVDETMQGGETRALRDFSRDNDLNLLCGAFGGVVSAYIVWSEGKRGR